MKSKFLIKIVAFTAFVAATLIFTLTPLKNIQPVERAVPTGTKVALMVYDEGGRSLQVKSPSFGEEETRSTFRVTSSSRESSSQGDSSFDLVRTSSTGYDALKVDSIDIPESNPTGGTLLGAVAGIDLADVDNFLSDNSENQQKLLDLEAFLKSKGVPLLVICILGFVYTFITRAVDLFFDKIAAKRKEKDSLS
jgi:hypothetical protein